MVRKQIFRPGDELLDAIGAGWLNSLETRLLKLENLSVHAPLTLSNTLNSIVISLQQRIDQFQFAQLNGELIEDLTAVANLAVRDSTQAAGSQWSEDTTQQIVISDPVGTRIPDNTIGMTFSHVKSDIDTRIFWPFPIRVYAVTLDADVLAASTFTADLLNLDGTAGTAPTSITIDNAIGLWDTLEDLDEGYVVKIDNTYYGIAFPTATDFTFTVTGDNVTGGPHSVANNDELALDGTTGSFSTRAQALAGVVTEVTKAGSILTVKAAVDESVLQWILLVGSAALGTLTIPIADSTAEANGGNYLSFESSTDSPVTLTGLAGTDAKVTFKANNPFHSIDGDGPSSASLNYDDSLDLEGEDQIITLVSKATTVVKCIIKNDYCLVRGQAVSGFTTATSSISIDTIKVLFGRDPGSSVTGNNIYAMEGSINDDILCCYNHEDAQWEMIQKNC